MIPRRMAIGTVFIVVVVVIVIAISTVAFVALTSSTPTSNSSSVSSSIAAVSWENPFTGAKPVMVEHVVCETPPDGLGICNGSQVEAGTTQSFNMTGSPATVGPVVYTDYFTVTANESDLLQFSYTYTNFTSFLEYFNSPSPYFSPESAPSDGQLLVNATNNNGVFSDQTTTQAGLYTFVFSLPNPNVTDSISFILVDSAAYGTGITINTGAPWDNRSQ